MPSSLINNGALAVLAGVAALVFMAKPVAAFGAGNIAGVSKIEGVNWRHGDIEDILLTLSLAASVCGGRARKFSKDDVKRVYFGNWLRDYSQAVDTASLKMVSVEAVNLLVWMLGFVTFGYGTKGFEVTKERLGTYQPTEHIDNPMGYAVGMDARDLDRRLRGPVDERRELAIDERTGMKVYIASEDRGISTSARFVRDTFRKSIECARRYSRDNDVTNFHEALRLLGTGLHTLEDFSAHSNYVELSLAQLGENDIFPHVGEDTSIELDGARDRVYPLVTGTFGGVDFLHSVMGEVSDKATQSEVQELEDTLSDSKNQEVSSFLKEILAKIPPGIIGGDQAAKADELSANAAAAGIQNMRIKPKETEGYVQQIKEILVQIRPVLEFHDELLQSISDKIAQIPILGELVENLQDQLNIFVFSLLAPYVLPVIRQVKSELATGSTEVIESSRQEQLVVFNDSEGTNPTHSMLSKDHFSNVLNTPAGKVASKVVEWAVPQLMECWNDQNADIDRTLDRIVSGVFHHPAQRNQGCDSVARQGRQNMFSVVEEWWNGMNRGDQSDMRNRLSREGVRNSRNHREDVHDSGHGCGKPLNMARLEKEGRSGNHGAISQTSDKAIADVSKMANEAVGGGVLGNMFGSLIGGVGGGLVTSATTAFEQASSEQESQSSNNNNDRYGGTQSRLNDSQPRRDNSNNNNDASQGYGQRQGQGSGSRYGSSNDNDYSNNRRDESSKQTGYGDNQRSSNTDNQRSSNTDNQRSGNTDYQRSSNSDYQRSSNTNEREDREGRGHSGGGQASEYSNQRNNESGNSNSNASAYGRRRQDEDDSNNFSSRNEERREDRGARNNQHEDRSHQEHGRDNRDHGYGQQSKPQYGDEREQRGERQERQHGGHNNRDNSDNDHGNDSDGSNKSRKQRSHGHHGGQQQQHHRNERDGYGEDNERSQERRW